MRPPTPRGSSIEGFRPATPGHVVSPAVTREFSANSPIRVPSTVLQPRRSSLSMDHSGFPDSPDMMLRSELLDMSSSSALNLSRANQLEESLIMAKYGRDRYEQELITEMERSSGFASRAARLEEANSGMKEELRIAQTKATAQARLILDLQAEAEKHSAHASSAEQEEAKSALAEAASARDEHLREAQTGMLHAQRDLELATAATQDSKGECKRLVQRLQAAEQRAEVAVAAATLTSAGAANGATDGANDQLKSLQLSYKHLRHELEKTKAETRDLPDMRKRAAALRCDTFARETWIFGKRPPKEMNCLSILTCVQIVSRLSCGFLFSFICLF